MSIIAIRALNDILEGVERHLSDEIHRTFRPGFFVDYQLTSPHVSATLEDPWPQGDDSWVPYEVVGLYDNFKIIIRPSVRTPGDTSRDVIIDGRSRRLRLSKVVSA